MKNYKEKIKKSMFYIGIVCILDFAFLMKIGVSLNLGTIIPVVLGVTLISFSYIKKYSKYIMGEKYFNIARKIIIVLFSIWLVTFCIIEGFIISNSYLNDNKKSDIIIVLGAGLRGDKLSLTLRERMDKCLEYMNNNPKSIVVVSGGQGIGETITEAEAMKNFLISKGIDESRIIKEEKSTSTLENLRFSKKILEEKNLFKKDIMIVTSGFHLFRSKILANSIGITAYGISAKIPFYLAPNFYIREYFAVIKLLIDL